MSSTVAADLAAGWRLLGTPREELRLEFTLPTGQSFRWRETGPDEYTGVVGQRVVRMRQLEDDVGWQVLARGPGADPSEDAAVLHDYFTLDTKLATLNPEWAAACSHFAKVHPFFPGCRMLRQDPVETLFQFLCSSNNHISRIQLMIERLCARWGAPLLLAKEVGAKADAPGPQSSAFESFFAFPTLDQLSTATEAELRAAGFGYRARFITGTVAALRAGGGAAWLRALRGRPTAEAVAALCELPGVGPKVASCVALFSLDAHDAIPVDVHVWNLACRHYTPHLRHKTLTPALHGAVQAAFVSRFGAYAGWAHNTLFVSDLRRFKDRVAGMSAAGAKSGTEAGDTSEATATTAPPQTAARRGRKRAQGALDAESRALGPSTPPLKAEEDKGGLLESERGGPSAPV